MNHFRATREGCTIVKSMAAIMALALIVPSSLIGTLLANEPLPVAFEADEILARVDSEVIMAADVLPSVLEDFNERKKAFAPEDHEKIYHEALVSQLMNMVKIKLLYVQALRAIPEDKLPDLKKMIEQDFEEKAVPMFMKNEQCRTRRELEDKLSETGNSIERVRRNFVETQIAQQWFRDQVKEEDVKVSNDEVLARYRETLATYEHPASVTYEELMAKLSKYPNKAMAQAALVEMQNLVETGTSFAEVAKGHSDGSTASEGGRREIRQGSHISQVVDKALFSVPVGTMSPILEDLDPTLKDRRGYYLVHVVGRKPAWTTSFAEVQAELADEMKKERIKDKQIKYMLRIFAETPPWTVFDRSNGVKQPSPPPDRYQR